MRPNASPRRRGSAQSVHDGARRRSPRGAHTVYLVGGATAVLEGWHESTIDIDVAFPDRAGPDELLRALPRIKDELELNVELASPADFVPVPTGWEERSPSIAREASVSFLRYDLYAQALSKLERGHDRDLLDVDEMLGRGLVERERLRELLRRSSRSFTAFRQSIHRAFGVASKRQPAPERI